MEPVPGVTATVFTSGRMELRHPSSGTHLQCDEVGTALWVALRREAWDVDRAVGTLATVWSEDPYSVREMVETWLAELHEAGLVA